MKAEPDHVRLVVPLSWCLSQWAGVWGCCVQTCRRLRPWQLLWLVHLPGGTWDGGRWAARGIVLADIGLALWSQPLLVFTLWDFEMPPPPMIFEYQLCARPHDPEWLGHCRAAPTPSDQVQGADSRVRGQDRRSVPAEHRVGGRKGSLRKQLLSWALY